MTRNDANGLRVEDGTARIDGDLTLDTVGGIFHHARRGNGAGIRAVDLSRVRRVDSSGLALLLEWQANRGNRDGGLEIRNAPKDLLRLARLCGAQDLLDLDGRGQEANDENDDT